MPERPDITKEAHPVSRIDSREAPAVEAFIENPTSVVVRAAPAVDVVIENPVEVVD
jgi:hypothetical protein